MVAQQSSDHLTGRTAGDEVVRLVVQPVLRLDNASITYDHAITPANNDNRVTTQDVCDRLRPSVAATGILNIFGDILAWAPPLPYHF